MKHSPKNIRLYILKIFTFFQTEAKQENCIEHEHDEIHKMKNSEERRKNTH